MKQLSQRDRGSLAAYFESRMKKIVAKFRLQIIQQKFSSNFEVEEKLVKVPFFISPISFCVFLLSLETVLKNFMDKLLISYFI